MFVRIHIAEYLVLSSFQFHRRAVMLNQWFGMLMQSFHLLPFLAKVRICDLAIFVSVQEVPFFGFCVMPLASNNVITYHLSMC